MNFAELLSLAKQNDNRAKVEIKSSKAPVTEYTTPSKEIKAKPDLKVIQARLKEHQQRVQQTEKINQKSSGAQSQGVHIAAKPLNAPGRSSSISVIPSKTATVPVGTKPTSSSSSLPKQSVRPVVATKNVLTSSSVGSDKRPNSQSVSKLSSGKPAISGKSASNLSVSGKATPISAVSGKATPISAVSGKATPNNSAKNSNRFVEVQKKIRPVAPPQPSFSSLLKMASDQQSNPEKSFMPPPPPPAQKPRPGEIRTSGQKGRITPISSSYSTNDSRRKESKIDTAKLKRPDGGSSVRNAHLTKDTQRPSKSKSNSNSSSSSSLYGKESQQKKEVKNGSFSNKSAPQSASRGSVQQPRDNLSSSEKQRHPYAVQTKKIPAVAGKIAPISRASGAAGSSSRPAPPSSTQPSGRVNRVYPNGPSFPAFRPPPRKRAHPDRYQDEDSDYDDEMDDFIVDNDEEDEDPSSISDHIRQIFGYDRRRYVGREVDDDDDLRHMETGVHTLWREEERSAEIGRLEDEIAEEEELEEERKLEEERRALQKKRDMMRKKKKMADD